MAIFQQPLTWNQDLLNNYDIAGPRYTSYPTAPQFRDHFHETHLLNAIQRSNSTRKPLSLYFHIPFCETLCYYCGCNKIVTHNKQRALPYLQRMIQELAIYADLFDSQRQVTQLHWGGGTPSFISDDEMSLLMHSTRHLFNLADDETGEFSIEIHPGKVSINTMHHLRQLGFNRVSMGVQDFDWNVQKAVNRYNSFQEIAELVAALKQDQYRSISMDLIYGLPKQHLSGFQQTLNKILDLSPDRLSIFNYAHMPHLFKSQALIRTEDLPDAAEKMDILHMAIQTLESAGYIYIGMDHFAKPGDDLVIAQTQGKLHRNFQGYSTHSDCDLLALGVSSISMIDNIYIQNVKDIQNYQTKLDAGLLPVARGFTLNEEDQLRRFVINQLICQLQLDYADVENFFGVNAKTHFRYQLQELEQMQTDGLLIMDETGIKVSNAGRLLIRRICMVFDEYLPQNNLIRYSKIM